MCDLCELLLLSFVGRLSFVVCCFVLGVVCCLLFAVCCLSFAVCCLSLGVLNCVGVHFIWLSIEAEGPNFSICLGG